MRRLSPRARALESQAFLKALAETGNAAAAARTLGATVGRFVQRRRNHPAFAAEWDAAIALAHAAIAQGDGPRRGIPARSKNGRLQLRRAPSHALPPDAEQRFLAALSATANVVLSAAAAGSRSQVFYERARKNPAFAREWRLALEQGYEAVETALLASQQVESHRDDAWRHNAPPPMPPMTANQALQLLYLHGKRAANRDEPAHIKRRRGESAEVHRFRLAAMYEARQARDREAFRVAEAARAERGEGPYWAEYAQGEAPGDRPKLPDLGQVTGWSRADPAKMPHDETRALFGGWRITDWKKGGKE